MWSIYANAKSEKALNGFELTHVKQLREFCVRDVALFVFSEMQQNELGVEVEWYALVKISSLQNILKFV